MESPLESPSWALRPVRWLSSPVHSMGSPGLLSSWAESLHPRIQISGGEWTLEGVHWPPSSPTTGMASCCLCPQRGTARWRIEDHAPGAPSRPPQGIGRPPQFPRALWAATKKLLRINKYRIEKIRKELASEECEYLENAGEWRLCRLFPVGQLPDGLEQGNCKK